MWNWGIFCENPWHWRPLPIMEDKDYENSFGECGRNEVMVKAEELVGTMGEL